MDTERALLAAATSRSATGRLRPASADQPVPVSRFAAGCIRAVVALIRFCAEVAGERGLDPILLEPRILRSA